MKLEKKKFDALLSKLVNTRPMQAKAINPKPKKKPAKPTEKR